MIPPYVISEKAAAQVLEWLQALAPEVSRPALRVAIALPAHRWDDHSRCCTVTQANLAREVGLSRSQVQIGLSELIAAGFLRIYSGHGQVQTAQTNTYEMLYPDYF